MSRDRLQFKMQQLHDLREKSKRNTKVPSGIDSHFRPYRLVNSRAFRRECRSVGALLITKMMFPNPNIEAVSYTSNIPQHDIGEAPTVTLEVRRACYLSPGQ